MDRSEFFALVTPSMTREDRQRVQWAYGLAKRGYEGRSRDNGERVFEHARGVAEVMIGLGYAEADDIIRALLHDYLEDTLSPVSMLERLFGPQLAREIMALSKDYGLEDPITGFLTRSEKRTPEEYFRGIERAGPRVIVTKGADREHNMSDLTRDQPADSRWTPEKRLNTVEETRVWVLPLVRTCEPRLADRLERLCAEVEASVARAQVARV